MDTNTDLAPGNYAHDHEHSPLDILDGGGLLCDPADLTQEDVR